ncbi:MAG TPA: hypothetical protein DHW22_11415 [Planctomycetaceae bacterium]|nr:hypothetical protein [Planctomycetaceae bacterium]
MEYTNHKRPEKPSQNQRIWQAVPITPFDAGCKHEYFIYSVARQTKDFFGKADNGAASPLPFREAPIQ